jgi:HK97 family phage major capsid protein
MILQAPALDEILRRDLGYLMREALDAAAFRGGGSNQPQGIIGTSGVTDMNLGTATPTLSQVITFVASMIAALEDGSETGRGFAVPPRLRGTAMASLYSDGTSAGVGGLFHNEPVVMSTALRSTLGA